VWGGGVGVEDKTATPPHHDKSTVTEKYYYTEIIHTKIRSIRFYNNCRRLPEIKRHSSLFLHWSGSKFLVVMAACTPSIHVFLSRPLFLLSSGNTKINYGYKNSYVGNILIIIIIIINQTVNLRIFLHISVPHSSQFQSRLYNNYRCKMLKKVTDFISAFQILPRHVSANCCHLQGVVGALQATQVMSINRN
jgi:hypothetical protein